MLTTCGSNTTWHDSGNSTGAVRIRQALARLGGILVFSRGNSAVADAKASLISLAARLIGAAFLLTAVILLLGIWLQWWVVFALTGLAIIVLGSRAGGRNYRR
jgi:VIT1/CCC1 family predicted Fe2+/Mn2+ transporter